MKQLFLTAFFSVPVLLAAHAQTVPAPAPQVRQVPHFRAIRVQGGIGLTLTAGHDQRVEVSAATPDFQGRLLTKVVDGTLQISYDDILERDDRKVQRSDHKLHVNLTADYISMLTATSGSIVEASGNFAAPDCVLDLSAGAALTATGLSPTVLVVRESSGATATLAGTAPRLDVRLAGGSVYDGQKLQGNRAQIEAGGGSTARILATQELMIEADGGSTVRYYGSPVVTKSSSGGSSISAK